MARKSYKKNDEILENELDDITTDVETEQNSGMDSTQRVNTYNANILNDQEEKTIKKYKTKICQVIKYNSITKDLDFMFDKYGIRLHNVNEVSGNTVEIEYSGTIGKPNFVYRLK